MTAFSGWQNSFFLQDASGGISVDRLENTPLQVGDEVEVTGQVKPGLYANVIVSMAAHVIRHAQPAPAIPSTYDDLQTGSFDSRLVSVTGTLHDIRMGQMWGKRMMFLDVRVGDHLITAYLLHYPLSNFDHLIDSQVRLTGVCGTIFNDRRQLIGLRLFMAGWNQMEVLYPAPDLVGIPMSRLESLLTLNGPPLDHRVHISGTVTYESWGRFLYLQEGKSAIRVINPAENLSVGTQVEVWGFVSTGGYSPVLQNASFRIIAPSVSPVALPVEADNIIKTANGFQEAPDDGLLVELEAKVVNRVPNTGSLIWTLEDQGVRFQVQLAEASRDWALQIEPGAKVKVKGICVAETDENRNLSSFHLLLRSPADMSLLRAAAWSQSLLVLVAAYIAVLTGSLLVYLFYRHNNAEPGLNEAESNPAIEKVNRLVSRLLAVLAAVISGVILLAAIYKRHHPEVNTFGVGPPAFIASPCFLLAAIAVGLQSPLSRKVLTKTSLPLIRLCCSWLVLVTGAAAFIGGIASWKFLATEGGFFSDKQLPLASALSFVFIGCSNIWAHSRRLVGVGQVLALLVAFTALLKLVGAVYGTVVLNGMAVHLIMSTPAAIELLLLAVALLLSTSDRGLMLTVSSGRLGGVMIRRLIPAAILVPVVLGWLRLQLQVFGFVDTRLGLTLFGVSNALLFCFILWSSAAVLNRLDRVRSRAERSLRERDEKLNLLFTTGEMGDYTWDVKRDEVCAHESVWKIYGYPDQGGSRPAEWFRQRQHPDDIERIATELSGMSKGEPFELEFRVIWPDESIHWVYCRAIALLDDSNNIVQTTGINIDTTARKEAEARLRQSETLFRELADAMPQIVWTSDHNGLTQYHNRRWYEYTGLTGIEWRPAVPEEDYDAVAERWASSIKDGQPYENEIRLCRGSDGAMRWHLARAMPIFNSEGELQRWFGTCTDIDDFKRATNELIALNETLERRVEERSQQLAETEQKYGQMVQSVKEYAIYLLDGEGKVANWNAGAQRLIGYTAEEILSRHFSLFHAPENAAPGEPQSFLECSSAEGRFLREVQMVRKDGHRFWGSILINPIYRADGQISGFSAVVRDMTEWRRARDLLISAQKHAEEANKAKSSFLATMSHEIRTPMNSILGMADLLWETSLSTTQRDYVGRFRRAGANLLTLINDILDLSKIESGRFELELIDFDLLELMERVMEIASPRARAKNITLKTHITPGIVAFLVGDPVRLQQILNNLMSNAIKFTPSGQIELRISAHPDGNPAHIQFAVADSGIGIPPDKLDAIFEDFTQAESSTTRRFGGTGLGLGICRRLAEKMGGRLTVQSEFGKGSIFHFDVVLAVSEQGVEPTGASLSDLAGLAVLIVDEGESSARLLNAMCSGWHMKPTVVVSVQTALAQLAAGDKSGKEFRLVLLDKRLAGSQNFTGLKELKRLNPSACVIVLSVDSQPGELTEAKAAGAAAYLLKPVRQNELLSSILATFSAAGNAERTPSANGSEEMLKVLLADDSEDNRFLVEAYLAQSNYQVCYAENGEEALEAYGRELFDVILMDVQMPVLDGLEATQQIRKLEQAIGKPPTVILAMTANALLEDMQRSLDAGCNGHLIKPISKDKLISALDGVRRRLPVFQR